MFRNLIILLCLIAPLTTFSQSVTNDKDTTLIALPRFVVLNVVRDLNDYDIVKDENATLTEQLNLQMQYVDQVDSANALLKKSIVYWQNIHQEQSQMTDTYKLQLDKVARQSEKRKKWLEWLSVALSTSIIINFAK